MPKRSNASRSNQFAEFQMPTTDSTIGISSPTKTTQDRRSFLKTAGAALAAGALAPIQAFAQRDWTGVAATRYPDPDIISLDPRFDKYKIGNTPIQRLYHNPNMLWAEGPAWNGVGRYLLWSDIPNDVQLRYLEEDGHVSIFRHPAGNSNGNTFDWLGRQIACEHGNRRVARYEYDGTVTILADRFNGKRFNAPNDAVVHPNGDIWFTDPGYGSMVNYEGNKAPLELKEAVYRIDGKTGNVTMVTDDIEKPNGLCFSPDYKKLYVTDTRQARPTMACSSTLWHPYRGAAPLAPSDPGVSLRSTPG